MSVSSGHLFVQHTCGSMSFLAGFAQESFSTPRHSSFSIRRVPKNAALGEDEKRRRLRTLLVPSRRVYVSPHVK